MTNDHVVIAVAEKLGYGGGFTLPFSELNSAEQTFMAVYFFENEVNSGGFGFYFSTEEGKYAGTAVKALEMIGAAINAAILRQAIEIFFDGNPIPEDQGLRQDIEIKFMDNPNAEFEKLQDEFNEHPEDLSELLYAFAKENKVHIRGAEAAFAEQNA